MRVLILTIEAFGGLGGIAKYSRDLSRALIAWPGCDEVVVVPRLRRLDNEAVPDGITQDDRAIGGKFRFLVRCLRWLVFGGRFDVIVCGHLNLLPFAALWRLRLGPPVMLAFYGIDAWQPHRSALSTASSAGRHIFSPSVSSPGTAFWPGRGSTRHGGLSCRPASILIVSDLDRNRRRWFRAMDSPASGCFSCSAGWRRTNR